MRKECQNTNVLEDEVNAAALGRAYRLRVAARFIQTKLIDIVEAAP